MAAAKTKKSNRAGRGRRVLIAALLVVVAVFTWYWAPLRAGARAETSYDARIVCSCRYIAGRSLSDCRKDLMPGFGLVMLSEDEADKSVTASYPPLARQTATFSEGQGCLLQPWQK